MSLLFQLCRDLSTVESHKKGDSHESHKKTRVKGQIVCVVYKQKSKFAVLKGDSQPMIHV